MIKIFHMKKIIAVMITFFIFTFVLIYLVKIPSDSLVRQLSSWNVSISSIENFIVEKKDTKRLQDSKIIDLTARRGEHVFRIKRITNMTKDVATRYIDDQKLKLESIFNPAPSPYFAVLTKEIECPQEFLPAYGESANTNNKVAYYILYANERFHYGVCSQDLIAYRAIYGMTYCENTEDVYLLEYFVPNQEYSEVVEETVRSFSCERNS